MIAIGRAIFAKEGPARDFELFAVHVDGIAFDMRQAHCDNGCLVNDWEVLCLDDVGYALLLVGLYVD